MRALQFLLIFLISASGASATSYAFSLAHSFAQSAIVAEVEILSSKSYVSDFFDFNEVEVECRVVDLFKGPSSIKSFKVRYYGEKEPKEGRAIVFAFRPGNELRVFNGGNCLFTAKGQRFGEVLTQAKKFQKDGTAKPMKGFSEGVLGDLSTLEKGLVTLLPEGIEKK